MSNGQLGDNQGSQPDLIEHAITIIANYDFLLFVGTAEDKAKLIAIFQEESQKQKIIFVEKCLEGNLEFVLALIACSLGRGIDQLSIKSEPTRKFPILPDIFKPTTSEKLLEVLEALNSLNGSNALSGLQHEFIKLENLLQFSKIGNELSAYLIRFSALIRNAIRCEQELFHGGETRDFASILNCSWKDEANPFRLNDVIGQLTKITSELSKYKLPIPPIITTYIGFLERGRKIAETSSTSTSKEVISKFIVWWSCYAYYYARINRQASLHSAACLLFLRSLELYLTSILIRKGNASLDDHGFIMAGQQLGGFGTIVAAFKKDFYGRRDYQAFFDSCSTLANVRNKIIYGHGVTHASAILSEKFCNDIEKNIKFIEDKEAGMSGVKPWQVSIKPFLIDSKERLGSQLSLAMLNYFFSLN